MSAKGRIRFALDLELEVGGATTPEVLAKATADAIKGTYVVTDGGKWIIHEVEMESSAVSRDGEHV